MDFTIQDMDRETLISHGAGRSGAYEWIGIAAFHLD